MNDNSQRRFAELERENADLKQRLEAVEHSHHLLRAVVEGTTDAVFVKGLRGRDLMANTAALNFVGKSVEEVLGHDDTLFFSVETVWQVMEREFVASWSPNRRRPTKRSVRPPVRHGLFFPQQARTGMTKDTSSAPLAFRVTSPTASDWKRRSRAMAVYPCSKWPCRTSPLRSVRTKPPGE